MPKISEVCAYLDTIAPQAYAMDFDNPGRLVGGEDQAVDKILIALDATGAVIDEAAAWGAQLLVTHHPLIFHKLARVVPEDVTGALVVKFLEGHITLFSMHTNLDSARGGVNDVLAQRLGIRNTQVLDAQGEDTNGVYGIGRWGELDAPMGVDAFLKMVRQSLGAHGLRYVAGRRDIRRVAVGGGACGEYLELAHALGCDAFVTADLKHDRFLAAKQLGMTLVDAGHFSTENPVCDVLFEKLSGKFPSVQVRIAQANTQPVLFYTED